MPDIKRTNTSIQIPWGTELLDTARDYFQFISKFFEVIKASAPHIYHSALELSPEDSIVRHHYSQCSLGHHTHVVCGISRSWDQPALIDGEYDACSWSPCGQFFSVQTSVSVEVWDSLTLEKQSTLQPLRPIDAESQQWIRGSALSYSPDGHFLVGFPNSTITIWDIQTGGVVKVIECSDISTELRSLVWSSDGQAIGAIFGEMETWVVYVYDINLGVRVSTSTLQSFMKPHLWSHNNSLCTMTLLASGDSQAIVNIFEIWPIFIDTPIRSFHTKLNLSHLQSHTISFSPAVYQICAITSDKLLPMVFVFDIQNSKFLLLKNGDFDLVNFSHDGSSLVTSRKYGDIVIWKYCSEEGYTLWMGIPSWNGSLKDKHSHHLFSPTLSSLLILSKFHAEVKYLYNSQATHGCTPCRHEQFSADGTYVVTVPYEGQVFKITNLDRIYSYSIKPGFSICGIALTKNILLVHGCNKVVGWQLTEAGMVHGASGDGVLDQDGRLWTVSVPEKDVCFWVGGCIGAISSSTEYPFCYNTETGEELEPIPVEVPSPSASPWEVFSGEPSQFVDQYPFSYHHFCAFDGIPKDSIQASVPWYEGGWIKYPQGKYWHKIWLPPYQRAESVDMYWFNDVTTLRFCFNELVIIKFHLGSPLS